MSEATGFRGLSQSQRSALLDGRRIEIRLSTGNGETYREPNIPLRMLQAFSQTFAGLSLPAHSSVARLDTGSLDPWALSHVIRWMKMACRTFQPYSMPYGSSLIENLAIYQVVEYLEIADVKEGLWRHLDSCIKNRELSYSDLAYTMGHVPPDSKLGKHVFANIEWNRHKNRLGDEERRFLERNPELRGWVDRFTLARQKAAKERREEGQAQRSTVTQTIGAYEQEQQ